MTAPTTKFLEKVNERELCRARLLELRRSSAQQTKALETLRVELSETQRLEKMETARFVDLNAEVVQLAHADIAGVVGKSASVAPAAVEAPSVPVEARSAR